MCILFSHPFIAFVDLSGNGTVNGCLDPNRDCAAMLQLWLLVSNTSCRKDNITIILIITLNQLRIKIYNII